MYAILDYRVWAGLQLLICLVHSGDLDRSPLHAAELRTGVSVTTDEPRKRDDTQEPRAYDFGKLDEQQAMKLQGKRVVVRLQIVERIAGSSGQVTYRCRGEGYADRFVSFRDNKPIAANQAKKRDLVVDAKLVMETSLRLAGKPVGYPAQLLLIDARIISE
jgi:hypothetical protein